MSDEITLLHVENDPMVARALRRMFDRHGLLVNSVLTCNAARREIDADGCSAEHGYAVGVFDIDLDDGDGVELASELLGKSAIRTAIFYTGTPSVDAQQRAKSLGELVRKDQGLTVLQRTIERQLRASRSALPRGGPGCSNPEGKLALAPTRQLPVRVASSAAALSVVAASSATARSVVASS